ncbi:MAG: indolepyruvate oxidoreductase subunit beta [Coriobacteriia bacterium]|nr:indolepyruvate oxidoreductase subunit beta [Coriobacteriia bacterium]
MGVTTVVLAGVGGQGTILAGDVLAKVAVAEGHEVKLSEVHGMAQRGGSVDTVVRFGEEVFSPVVDRGMADHLIAFEIIEGARTLPYLRPGGRLVVNRRMVAPLPVLIGDLPAPEDLEQALVAGGAVLLDAEALACEAGSPRSANVVLLGAASYGLPFAEATWTSVIEERVPPKTVEANLRAFALGRHACAEGVCEL